MRQEGQTITQPTEWAKNEEEREKGKATRYLEAGRVEKVTQPAEMGTFTSRPELCCSSTVRPKSTPSPGCSQLFPMSGVSGPPTCQSRFLLAEALGDSRSCQLGEVHLGLQTTSLPTSGARASHPAPSALGLCLQVHDLLYGCGPL